MALDFNVLTQVPSFGERFAAGRQAAQEEQSRNMLLQQRQMEFQQSQDDRKRKLLQETQFQQLSDLVAQHGMDPDDPKILGQFAQAALKSGNSQLATLVGSMAERAAKRRLAAQEAADVKAAMAGPGALTGLPEAVTETRAAAPAIEAPPAVAPQELSRLAVEQAGYARPRGYAQGQFVGGAPTAMTSSVGAYPAEPAPRNLLAPTAAAPVNAMAAPPAQVAAPPALPGAARPKVDIDKLQADYDAKYAQYTRVTKLTSDTARKTATTLKADLDLLGQRIKDARDAEERAEAREARGPEIVQLQRRLAKLPSDSPDRAGLEARIASLTREPGGAETLQLLARLRQTDVTPEERSQIQARLKFLQERSPGTTVKVELPPQEKAERGERGKMLVEQYKGVSDAARLATRTLPALETQERVLDAGFRTGFGAEAQKAGASLLAALGVPEAKDYATNAQTFSAAMSQAVLQKQLEQKGTQTKADSDRIEQTGAQLTNTADANRFIIAVARAQLKRDIAQRNFYDKWWKENKTYDGAEDAWATGEGNKSLFEDPALKKFAPPATRPEAAVEPARVTPYADPDKERRYQEWKAKQGAR